MSAIDYPCGSCGALAGFPCRDMRDPQRTPALMRTNPHPLRGRSAERLTPNDGALPLHLMQLIPHRIGTVRHDPMRAARAFMLARFGRTL